MTTEVAFEEISRRMDLALSFGVSHSESMRIGIRFQSEAGKVALSCMDICVKAFYLAKYLLRRSDKNKKESALYVQKAHDLFDAEIAQ